MKRRLAPQLGGVFSAGRGRADRSRAEEKSTPGPRLRSAMAAGDTATVFLETTLGTRLVVSFPAGATTVADLKGACLSISSPILLALPARKKNLHFFLSLLLACCDSTQIDLLSPTNL